MRKQVFVLTRLGHKPKVYATRDAALEATPELEWKFVGISELLGRAAGQNCAILEAVEFIEE